MATNPTIVSMGALPGGVGRHRRPRDAVVIGAGPNGLVAANLLVDAGWDVLVLEAQPTVGGAVRHDSGVAGGFVHDEFSAFYPLSLAGPTIPALGLENYGLRWVHAPAVLGNPQQDGSWAMLHRRPEDTIAGLDELSPGDGAAWRELYEAWQIIGPSVVRSLLTPFPPVRGALSTLARLPKVGGFDYVRFLLEPASVMGGARFRTEHGQLLIAGNALHADIAMDSAGSGLLGLMLAMSGQAVGFPVPEGGSGRLTQAMADRLVARGGLIQCDTRVDKVLVDRRRVQGVVTAAGERIEARAVVADVSAPALYGDLVGYDELPDRVRRGMARFEFDPATIKVDWALSGPVPWASTPPSAPGTVHIIDSMDQLSRAQAAITSHSIPAEPFLLVGQMTTADPTRSPAGTEALWAYTHVPQEARRDDGPDGLTGRWDRDECERFADRMQARIEKYAPDLASRIIARRVLGPYELQARNENLVRGALGGGTANLQQQLIFRPVTGTGRADTAVRGLFLGSASAHPGGGVHGAPGSNAARAVLAAARTGRL
ncbi:phytoene desaturase family protein [uncultured Friedmanniella sp.]|uniref:phytoene desaturase family protein n=1 Tax=uncultured Friedmanniella sp. TaxID=335381 RepID=UPI0035CA314A